MAEKEKEKVKAKGDRVPINWRQRLREIREAKGWTRADIAEAVGSSPRTVEAWVGGKHRPDRRSRRVLRGIWRDILVEGRARALSGEGEDVSRGE